MAKRKNEEEVETEADLMGVGSVHQLIEYDQAYKHKVKRKPKIGFDLEEVQKRNAIIHD
jgi:hypothetical protein